MVTIPLFRFAGLTLFSIAFAWMESAVVHYLHLLYYPNGFAFPLAPWPAALTAIEFGREIGTVIVLATVAVLAGKTRWSHFAWFMFCFGIWDIFYYLWLVLFEGWPQSLFTIDLLFLVPAPWAGPVLAPLLVSSGLIASALVILLREGQGAVFRAGRLNSALTLSGWAIILASFMLDAGMLMTSGAEPPFHWEIFLSGCILWLIALLRAVFGDGADAAS